MTKDTHKWFCQNCGDPFDDIAERSVIRLNDSGWKPCPNPSPGKPLVHCGIGGHMYTDRKPAAS